MKKIFGVMLGVVTSIGGFLEAGTISTSGQAGSQFGLGLIWAILVATIAVILLVEMAGRLTAVSGHTYAEAVRERFGFKFYLLPLTTELIAETILLTAELGGISIALSLVTGISWRYLLPLSALLVIAFAWRASFGVIENLPGVLGLVALSFLAGIIALGGPSHHLMPTLWHPEITPGEPAEYLFLVAGILGATISPNLLYFYSSGASQEGWTKDSLRINKATAILGMGFGSVASISVVVLTAMVLKPLNMSAGTLGELGISLARPFGQVGVYLFAATLFITCFGAALELVLPLGFMLAQGLGWEWGQDKKPTEAPRYNLAMLIILVVAFGIGLIGLDPLTLALVASAVIALVLPVSLFPLLAIMNDEEYLQDKVNGRLSNIATVAIIVMASIVALVSLPLLFLSGGA